MPDKESFNISRRLTRDISRTGPARAKGDRIRVAHNIRYAATASGGASARRTKIEAHETDREPMMSSSRIRNGPGRLNFAPYACPPGERPLRDSGPLYRGLVRFSHRLSGEKSGLAVYT
jgi:hypothetical protein